MAPLPIPTGLANQERRILIVESSPLRYVLSDRHCFGQGRERERERERERAGDRTE